MFHIVLPFCVESEFDVFLTVLKSVVGRSTIEESSLICAFMSAVNGKSFVVKKKDLTRNWKHLQSERQRIRQMKLLGFWTKFNFPSFARKFIDETSANPARNELVVVENSSDFDAGKIDEMIAAKLTLRVVELSVKESTFIKLKDYVKVPAVVGAQRSNESRISRKMISFEVDEDHVPDCWEALKSGVFSMDSDEEQQDHTVMYPFVATDMDDMDMEVEDTHIDTDDSAPSATLPKRVCRRKYNENMGAKEQYLDNCIENAENDSAIGSRMLSAPDVLFRPPFIYPERNRETGRERTFTDTNIDETFVESDTSNNNSQSRKLIISLLQYDSLREIVLQVRDNVGALSKSIEVHGSERLHIMMMKQKDDEIERLKKSTDELQQVNGHLLKGIEDQKSIVASLKKELDDKDEVGDKCRTKLAASLESNVQLKNELELLTGKLAAAKDMNRQLANELKEVNGKLVKEIEGQKSIVDSLKKELDDKDEVGDKCRTKLAASLELNVQLKNELELLTGKLAAADGMKKQLATFKKKNDQIMAELGCEIESLEKINSESQKRNEQLEQVINLLKSGAGQGKINVATQTCEEETALHSANPNGDTSTEMESTGHIQTDIEPSIDAPTEFESINNDANDSESEFDTNDAIVRACRPKLLKLKFGWIKFGNQKRCKYFPGFAYPADDDGQSRAQKIMANGYPSETRNVYFEFNENILDGDKKSAEKLALSKFNAKFKLNFE